jgi:hypothetical protein
MTVGIAAGAAMWTAAGLVRRARDPEWHSDLAAWQEGWARRGLPGTPGDVTSLAIVATFGAMHAFGYVAMRRVLPRGAVRSGAVYGIATNASLWTASWAASRYLGETKRPTGADATGAVRSAAYGGLLGWIVARA